MIVVTTPTGQIGSKAVAELLGAGSEVRVVTRDGSKLPSDVSRKLQVVTGSHGDAAVMTEALEGADALFWIVPPDMRKTVEAAWLDFSQPAVEAIRRSGIKRLVAVTALGRGTRWQGRAGLASASLAMDDLLASAGVAFRALAIPSFMENTARQLGAMKAQGKFFGPIHPDKKLPFTATRDIAAVAARVLLDDSWTGQKEIPVLGPEDLSHNDQAAIISEVTGRQVRYQQISWEQFKQQFLDRGATESFAQGYVEMYRAKDEGMDNAAEHQANGRQETSFRQFCEAELRPALATEVPGGSLSKP